MQLIPYLTFDGQCREAFEFYARVFKGKIDAMMTFGESPMSADTPPEARDKILHASMQIDGQMLMASDAPGGRYETPQGLSVTLNFTDRAEAERVYHALAENAKAIQMPLQQTFWADRFGMLVDRYGTPWMVNCAPPA